MSLQKTCTQLLTETSFVITWYWKQPKCLLVGKELNKLVYPHHIVPTQQWKMKVFATTWMDLKGITLIEKKKANLKSWFIYKRFIKGQNHRHGKQISKRKGKGWCESRRCNYKERALKKVFVVIELFCIMTVVMVRQIHAEMIKMTWNYIHTLHLCQLPGFDIAP